MTEEKETREFEEAINQGVWALVFTPGGKYVGQLRGVDHVGPTDNKQYFIEHLTNPMALHWAMEFFATMVTKVVQTPEGPKPAFERVVQAQSIACALNIPRTRIIVTPTDLLFFSDMAREDKLWHENMLRIGIRIAVEGRGRSSNIITPPPERGSHTGHA